MFGFVTNLKISTAFGLLTATLITVGCAGANDNADLTKISASNTGLVFGFAAFPPTGCRVIALVTGRDLGESYKWTGIIYPGKPSKIPAGEHHITQVNCMKGIYHTRSLGKGGSGLKSGKNFQSFAKFTIRPGEVLDIGVLILHVEANRVVKSEVKSLTSVQKGLLMKEYPNLYKKAQARLMTLGKDQSGDYKRTH